MASIIDICNGALTLVGAAAISSLEDNSNEARLCKLHYDMCRKSVLRRHPWKFAKKRVITSPLSDAPAFGWTYAHQLPSDFIRVVQVTESDLPYEVEGKNLLCDSDVVELQYIYDLEQSGDFDPLFIEALSAYLGWKIAYRLTQSTTTVEECMRAFKDVIKSARFVDATENPAGQVRSEDFDDARLRGPLRFDPGT